MDKDVPAPLDDRVYVGGRYIFAGTAGKHLISFTGPCKDPRLETLDIEDSYQSVITMARPIIDNGQAKELELSLSVTGQQQLQQTLQLHLVDNDNV